MTESIDERIKRMTKEGKISDPGHIKQVIERVVEEVPETPKHMRYFKVIEPKRYLTFVSKILGDELMKEYTFKTREGDDAMFVYDMGVYKENATAIIRKEVQKRLGEAFSGNYLNETITYIKASTPVNPKEIDHGWINLENGLLDPLTGEFIEHTPEVFSVTRVPIEYKAKAECPTWVEELQKKLDADTYLTVQEMFGYCYVPSQKQEKAFIFYGPPRTMKSTVLYILCRMLGDDNIKSFALQELNPKNFAVAYLYGKLANVCADITAQAFRDTEMFMKIVGGDSITAEQKHKDPLTFSPHAKLIFSCNVVPMSYNRTTAFYRRWILLPFLKQTDKDDVDDGMRDKLEKELPGILNWALEGLRRLEKNGKFTYDPDDETVKDIYEKQSDTVQSFIFNHIDDEDDAGKVKKREVYKKYVEYCEQENLTPKHVVPFGKEFRNITGCGHSKIDEIPAYTGISLKKEIKVEKKDEKDFESWTE
jgi:putative DNA primase/helicase